MSPDPEAPQSPGVPTPASSEISHATGLPRNIAAGLASLFSLFGGIVFLYLERSDRFVRFYAMQAIILGAIYFAISLLLWVLGGIFSMIPLIKYVLLPIVGIVSAVAGLAFFVLYAAMTVQAFRGKEWDVPGIAPYAKKYLPTFGAKP